MRISMLWLLDSHAVGQTSVTSMGVRVCVCMCFSSILLSDFLSMLIASMPMRQ